MSSNGDTSPSRPSRPNPNDIPQHLRRKHPCVLCQQRKVKCDRNEPCQNCTKARVECISPLTLPPKKRKRRFPEAELLARIKRYEEVLRGYGADLDAINGGNGGDGRSAGEVRGNVTLAAKLTETEGSGVLPRIEPVLAQPSRSMAIRKSLKGVKNNLWTGLNEDFRDAEEILQGSDDDEFYENPITSTYDAINEDGGDFLFPTQQVVALRDLHPTPVQIFRLWQTFIDCVNPLIKIFHAPTIQQQVLDASANLNNVEKGMEALMFGIYSISVNSMDEEHCLKVFGEEKSALKTKYQNGARQAFRRCGLLRSSDLTILQAYVLYLYSCLNFCIDPRSLFCLTGIAVRIAQRMGLNFDGTSYGLLPFETEMRRRLWWQIVLLDFRVSELSGAGCSILTHVWTTKLPLNINDSDLFPDMRDPPSSHPGRVTEMIYVLQRCECAQLLQTLRNSTDPLPAKDAAIQSLSTHIEETYLQYCDPSVPLHFFSTMSARSGICKLHIGLRHPHLLATTTLPKEERDRLFRFSLTMIENHNIMLATKALKPFLWHNLTNMPFPAHVYLLVSLRHAGRATDALADRAWAIIAETFRLRAGGQEHTPNHKPKGTALQLAIANLTVKAWEARVRAWPDVATPTFIDHFRHVIMLRKKRRERLKQGDGAVGGEGAGAGEGGGQLATPTDSGESEYASAAPADPLGGGFQWGLNEETQMMDFGGGLDGSGVLGLAQDTGGGLSWEFWNDLMQPGMGMGAFDVGVVGGGGAGQGVYPG